jgi:thiamine-phosphate pyrophosphorylase
MTPENDVPDETAAIDLLAATSVTGIHLRKPTKSKEELATYLKQLQDSTLSKIILHSHPELARDFSIKGVQINRYLTMIQMLNSKISPNYLSYSAHSLADLRFYASQVHQICLSPIFESISKKGHRNPELKHNEIKKYLTYYAGRAKIFALGGVCEENIPAIKEMKFQGLILMGTLWEKYKDVNDASTLVKRIEKLF